MEYLDLISVPAITAIVYAIVSVIKIATKNNEKVLRFVPLMALVLGVICGIVAFYAVPSIVPASNVVVAIVIGGASGLTATGFNQIVKQLSKKEEDKKTAADIEETVAEEENNDDKK